MNSSVDYPLNMNPAYRKEPVEKRDKVLVPVYDHDGEIIDRETVGYTYAITEYLGETICKVWIDTYSISLFSEDVTEAIEAQRGNMTFEYEKQITL